MVLERTMSDGFLTNTYLVGTPGGPGFFVDAGDNLEPLIAKADEHGITPTHVLLTHHHWDHVSGLPVLKERWPDLEVLSDPWEAEQLTAATPDLGTLVTGELPRSGDVEVAGLTVTVLHTPGHTAGMLNLLVDGHVFTGDTLFKGSVGGVRAPGSTSFEDIRASVMEVLLGLPDETVVHPGHTDPTTIGDERADNRFVRVWNGTDPEGDEPCTALGEPARLVLLGDDYDGGHKAWVRWPDGKDDIVPGSKVEQG